MHLLDGSRNSSTSRIADLLHDSAVIPATFSPDPGAALGGCKLRDGHFAADSRTLDIKH